MRPDRLARAARLRRLAAAEAERQLANALAAEQHIADRCRAMADQVRQEVELARGIGVGDPAVEALGYWLRRAEADRVAAETARESASAVTARARATLAAARAAEESLAELRRRTAADAAQRSARKSEVALDEAAGRRAADRQGPAKTS